MVALAVCNWLDDPCVAMWALLGVCLGFGVTQRAQSCRKREGPARIWPSVSLAPGGVRLQLGTRRKKGGGLLHDVEGQNREF